MADDLKVVAAEEPQRRSFWDRKDVQNAMTVVDVWASVKWHTLRSCNGVPTMDWLNGRDEYVMKLIRTGAKRFDVEIFTGTDDEWEKAVRANKAIREEISGPSTSKEVVRGRHLPAVRVLELTIDALLKEFDSPALLIGLLLHRYPRSGPYARPDADIDYRKYRPPGLLKDVCGHLRGKQIERNIDKLLECLEREFLLAVADIAVVYQFEPRTF